MKELDLLPAEIAGIERLNAEITQLMSQRTGALRLLASMHGLNEITSVDYRDGKLLYTTPPQEKEQP